jgi:hypothetical protein
MATSTLNVGGGTKSSNMSLSAGTGLGRFEAAAIPFVPASRYRLPIVIG